VPLPIETVAQALNRRPVPFVPRGELFIYKNFLDHFFSRNQGHYIKQLKGAAERLGLSVIGVELVPGKSQPLLDEGAYRVLEPYFMVGCINGPISGLIARQGFLKAMAAIVRNPASLAEIAQEMLTDLKKIVQSARTNGFRAVAITDDIAGNQGLYFSFDYFRETLWPIYKVMTEIIKEQGMFAFFHSDGDIRKIIGLLIQAEIDCIHPVDSQAGQDLHQLTKEFGQRVCFMGHIDPLTWSGERVQGEIDLAETEFKNGGLILGSTCGLSMETFNEKFGMLYPQWAD
jgi:uroporphyrinogen-III decarboxylase